MLYQKRFDLATVDTDGVVEDATGDLQDAALTLIQTAPPDGIAHKLEFIASGDISSADFIVVGLDADGNSVTETVTGITTSPVATANYYSSLTSITGADNGDSDISTATLDVGWCDEAVSPTIPLGWRRDVPAYFSQVESGTLEVDVQLLAVDPGKYSAQESMPWYLFDSQLDDFLNNERFAIGPGYTAARLKVNSYSTGAEVTLAIVQAEVV